MNNAGVGLVSIVECVPIEPAKNVFDINYFGVLRMLKAVLPKMKERQEGRIINISSVLGVVGKPFNDVYCSSKFAVEGLTESLAPVLNKFNIRYSLHSPHLLRLRTKTNISHTKSAFLPKLPWSPRFSFAAKRPLAADDANLTYHATIGVTRIDQ